FFTTRLDFTLRSPALPNFERAFTVGRLQLKRIELKDGTTLTPSTATAVRFGTAAKDGVLTRPLFLVMDAKPSPDTIKAVSGVLTMHFPRTIRTLHLDDLTPGQDADAGGMSVTVTARGRQRPGGVRRQGAFRGAAASGGAGGGEGRAAPCPWAG